MMKYIALIVACVCSWMGAYFYARGVIFMCALFIALGVILAFAAGTRHGEQGYYEMYAGPKVNP